MYDKTHRLFKINFTTKGVLWGSEESDLCRKYLGDNNLNDLLQNRKWFTCFEGIYIRHDCLNNELVSWLALKDKNV